MYTGIKSIRNGYAAIHYPLTNKKNQKGQRVDAFRCGGGIVDTGDTKGLRRQFAYIWKRGNRGIGDIMCYSLLFSFSARELIPEDPDAQDTAADIAQRVIGRLYPGHQWILAAQHDGKSGHLHVHAVVSALDRDTLRACGGRQTLYSVLEETADAALREAGIEPDIGQNHEKRERKRRERTKSAKAKDGYSWMEDLAGRIRAALSHTLRFSDLDAQLSANGVDVLRRTDSNWTFALAEDHGKKSRGSRMDAGFTPQQMRRVVDENYSRIAQQIAKQGGTERQGSGKARPESVRAASPVRRSTGRVKTRRKRTVWVWDTEKEKKDTPESPGYP